ncbi:MAG TPA: tyrosine--tRNA ligase [Anaerolineae bacterium]|nr:tyrosine--tRNA ligase [Anaerolineae bacterium]
MSKLNIDEQVDLLMQGTEYGDERLKQAMTDELRERLQLVGKEGRPLRVYCGFDPRTSDLHLGHMVPIRKMRQFQEMGHEVTFVIGRFTSLIGDPSDKDKVRAQIELDQARKNAETYAEQAVRILDPEKTRFAYNDTWLSKLTFRDLIEFGSLFTIQQFLAREAFRKRFDEADAIFMHEFFYAIMQGYDAFHLQADVQIGGSDQLFNIITAARKLMEARGMKPNIGIILGILPGTDGVVKMSKSLGNHIPLTSTPEDMYGKVMSVPDVAMGAFMRLMTRWTPPEITQIEADLKAGKQHPRDVKMHVAKEITAIYMGDEQAEQAEAHFVRVFQEQQDPEDMAEFRLTAGITLLEVLVNAKLVKSKSEGRRLIEQQGVRLEDQILEDPKAEMEIGQPQVLRVGKRRFVRLLPPKK